VTPLHQKTSPWPPVSVVILLAMAGLIFVLHAGYYWPWLEDDAFITYRYAQNLTQGEGLVFNPGERVEGYSNPLWVLLSGLALKAGLAPWHLARATGILGGLLCLLFSWRLALRIRPTAGLATAAAPLILALTPMLPRHAVTGLETVPYAAFLAAALLLSGARSGRMVSTLLVATLIAVSLLRPEGFVFALLILGWRMAVPPRSSYSRREGLVYLVLMGAFVIWRWTYYDALFPNTYQAKMTGEFRAIIDGLNYTLDFLREFGGVVIVGLYLANLLDRTTPRIFWLMTAVIAVQVGIVVFAGGDWMHFYRFFVPLLPVAAAGMAAGLAVLLRFGGKDPEGPHRRFVPGFILGAVLLVAFTGSYKVERASSRLVMPAVREGAYLTDGYREAARWIVENTDEDMAVAVSDIGLLGYFTGRRIIDMFGLVDAHIARTPGRQHFKNDADYVMSRNPDVVVLVVSAQGDYLRIPDAALASHPHFGTRFELVHTIGIGFRAEVIQVYLRK